MTVWFIGGDLSWTKGDKAALNRSCRRRWLRVPSSSWISKSGDCFSWCRLEIPQRNFLVSVLAVRSHFISVRAKGKTCCRAAWMEGVRWSCGTDSKGPSRAGQKHYLRVHMNSRVHWWEVSTDSLPEVTKNHIKKQSPSFYFSLHLLFCIVF